MHICMQTENFVPGSQRSIEKLIKMVVSTEVEKRFLTVSTFLAKPFIKGSQVFL